MDKITLIVEDARFAVSKSLLVENSPVFKAVFESGMQEATSNELIITNFSELTVSSFLILLNPEASDDIKAFIMNEYAKEFYKFADKYQFLMILTAAEQHLISNAVFSEDFIPLLLFADQYDISKLKQRCFEILVQNPKVFTNPHFCDNFGNELTNEIFSFLALHMLNSRPHINTVDAINPSSVKLIVSGARNVKCNGIYVFGGIHNGGGYYKHENQKESAYVIYKDPTSDGFINWVLMSVDSFRVTLEFWAPTTDDTILPGKHLIWKRRKKKALPGETVNEMRVLLQYV